MLIHTLPFFSVPDQTKGLGRECTTTEVQPQLIPSYPAPLFSFIFLKIYCLCMGVLPGPCVSVQRARLVLTRSEEVAGSLELKSQKAVSNHEWAANQTRTLRKSRQRS